MLGIVVRIQRVAVDFVEDDERVCFHRLASVAAAVPDFQSVIFRRTPLGNVESHGDPFEGVFFRSFDHLHEFRVLRAPARLPGRVDPA